VEAPSSSQVGPGRTLGAVATMMARLGAAMNGHDLDGFVNLFSADYRSEQPAHPSRAFRGADQVRENWAAVFAGVPNLAAELLSSATAGVGVEVGEWSWHGTYIDGSDFAMKGVIVVGVEDERIAWARLYMEPVERGGAGIDEMVHETYRPPDRQPGS
jgi:ketosteroid isomerase-like protein